jgi:hypothetical protein
LNLAMGRVGAYQGRVPVEEDELVPGAELEQSLKQPLGVDPNPASVLVVVPQHDANPHCPRSASW